MRNPPLQHTYAANVALVVLALFPGLINTSAIGLLSPVIGGDLGVTPDAVGRLPLFNDAALAFGALLAADVVRFVDGRRYFYLLLCVSLVTSLVSALATNFTVLVVTHIVHGLAAGNLFIVMLPPLVTGFGGKRLGSSAAVLVPSLFGAAALGPVVGAFVAAPHAWRAIFAAEVVVSLVTMGLAVATLAERPASDPLARPDWFAHIVSGCAAIAIFIGAGGLAGHDWNDLAATIPVALGVVLFVALIVGENFLPHALVPVRGLSTSLALVGIIATMTGSACFAALTQSFILILERLAGLSVRATGLATWPEFIAALIAGLVFGRLVTTKWIAVVGISGLAILAVTLALTIVRSPPSALDVTALSFLAGLGSGAAVTPGLLLVALTYPRAQVGRAIAMLNLLRLTGTYITGPLAEHGIGSQTRNHFAASRAARGAVDGPVREFVVYGHVAPGVDLHALQAALAAGIRDIMAGVLVLACMGLALIAVLLVRLHRPLISPDLAAFDRGQPALATAGERTPRS
ncbi:MAG: MFS transporter [Candidatus Velthaea sp.]